MKHLWLGFAARPLATAAMQLLPPLMPQSLSSSPVACNVSVKSPPSGDPECNLILFGLPESRSIFETKDSMDEIMEFLAGKEIPVK